MRSISSTALPLALVALLTALTFWLERATNPDDPVRKAEKRHDPDYIISRVDIRHFDVAGLLKQSLLADSMTHYPDDDSTQIAKPQLTYHNGPADTQVFANTAHVTKDNKQVFLRGDVRLIKPPLQDKLPTVMQTEALTVFPDDQIAQGNSRVTITHGESIVSGDNVHYSGKTSIAILSGRVKGTFYRVRKS
jgi:lipopolysaccharide export system protein LptC